jgi:hypothetical protein
MQVVRVGPLPDRAIDAAAAFYANPPRTGEGDHAKHGGGAPSASPGLAGEDLVLIFSPASHDHRSWRLAAIQDLARAAAPTRVNGIVGSDEQAIAATLAWLDEAPGVTGQLLSVGNG